LVYPGIVVAGEGLPLIKQLGVTEENSECILLNQSKELKTAKILKGPPP
jgi:hypothetical protein